MNNISTNLLRFNGEIGPQYLDPDDKTGGPDGTMKPITKDVLREMIMLNLPEIQKVQDEYVKAELESIKQTQQQILQRLNQPINTQLTGSNVEYNKKTNTVFRSGVLATGISETLLEIDKPIIIHDFVAFFGRNDSRFRFELEVYNGSAFTPYRFPISPTAIRTAITPDRTKYTSFFEETEENVVILTKQLELRGVRVVLVNALEEDEDIAVTITYSEVDES